MLPEVSETSGPRRVMGVHCSAGTAYVSILEGRIVLEAEPMRLTLPDGEQCRRLQTFVDDLARTLVELKICAVGILRAEHQPPGKRVNLNVSALERRTVMETLIQLAAVQAGVDVSMLERPTVRKLLILGKEGKLDEMLPPPPSGAPGLYWKAGRGLAAFAAQAKIAA